MKKLLIAALMCGALALSGCGKKKEEPYAEPVITDLEVMDAAGYDKLKEKYKGKLMIINFFASWCPPCKEETPDFVSVYEDFKDKNFVIVGLSIDDSKEDAIDFVNRYRITYPVYLASPALQRRYNVSKIPTSFIYNGDGQLANIAEGIISGPMLRRMAEMASGEAG